MSPLDVGRFDVLTFDCYGTLIDWETGIADSLHAVRPGGWPSDDEELLARFAVHEAAAERGPYRPYREVLTAAVRGIAGDLDVPLSPDDVRRFSESVGHWPAFPDSRDALARLAARFRLGVITNCDDDLFAASKARLGVEFDWIVTAQQVRSYKPDRRNFEVALERIGLPTDRILHVAQSLYHDHVPARSLGLATVWIDRRRGRSGSGATPSAEAHPDATFPTLEAFARAALLADR
jgi:2-haloacid dehalogenase